MGENIEKYPELKKIGAESYDAVMSFIAFLEYEGYEITKNDTWTNSQNIVYEFFEIDKNKLEEERTAMLDEFTNNSG